LDAFSEEKELRSVLEMRVKVPPLPPPFYEKSITPLFFLGGERRGPADAVGPPSFFPSGEDLLRLSLPVAE